MQNIDWLGAGALLVSSLALLRGYLRAPMFVPAGSLEDLQRQVTTLQSECERLTKLSERREQQIEELRNQNEYLLKRLRMLENGSKPQ